MDHRGVPATELTDEELARQGTRAHATRNWVFLHGTAEQFRHHTERMLELEQEYLHRYPKRTWQGSGGAVGLDLAEVDTLEQVRHLTRAYATAVDALLAHRDTAKPASDDGGGSAPSPGDQAEIELLRRYAAAPDGRLHKLVTAGEYRRITPEGRARAGVE